MADKGPSKGATLARDQGLIVGFPKRMGNAQILVEGTTYTASTAVALLQKRVAAETAVVPAKAAYQAAVKAANAEISATAATVSGFVEAIYVAFGDDPAALADFGLPARKKPVLSPAEKEAATAKAKATRAARHTMGPKQKVLSQTREHPLLVLRAVA
jgi:hypothetical protein